MVFYVSVTGVYAFVALQGQTWGLSENQISSAVTVALLVGCGGSFLVGVLADRFVSPVTLVVVFVAGTASAFGCLMLGGSGSEHSYTTFRLALLQLNVWWNGAASARAWQPSGAAGKSGGKGKSGGGCQSAWPSTA